eukprot:Tamp_24843.p1 GENE.Tamp_24843~~Tamp_24843.p1  ORF type:complete len:121 (-),score=17.37 Tamp_24843:104-466(-)
MRVLGCMSTYKEFHEVGAQLPSQVKISSPKQTFRPKLQVYTPEAICNRLPVIFNNEAIPCARFCAPRNVHQVALGGKNYERRFLTHNKAMYPKWDGLPLGFENGGVMSDFARKVHEDQAR